MKDTTISKRILLLTTTTGYQTRAFARAAEKLGLTIVLGTDRCHVLQDPWQDGALPLRFEDSVDSARQIVDYARTSPIDGIVSLGDRPTPTASRACLSLKLPHHPPKAADICRDKYQSRERLRAAGLNVPAFTRFPIQLDPREILSSDGRDAAAGGTGRDFSVSPADGALKGGITNASRIEFPCVLKPLALSASRGVIRANNPQEFIGAFERIRNLLRSPEVQVMREGASQFIQVESYIEGEEIAVEGLLDRGRVQILAIFDKPDPLLGPFFEETLYITPSRLKQEMQTAVVESLQRATRALGLFHGPLHAELRLNSCGVWILEVAARSIGGLCARALRFTSPDLGNQISLEELIVRLALGEETQTIRREEVASGVMMIPVPEAGIFQEVSGVEAAKQIPGVEDIVVTAKPYQMLIPLPEGSSYLGFIFARGPSPAVVERVLRQAHGELNFVIAPALPVI